VPVHWVALGLGTAATLGGDLLSTSGSERICRLQPITALIVTAALCGCLAACSKQGSDSERSVILITLDTTRSDRIGAYGGTRVPTPNLDRIAEEGVLIEEAISQVPLTLPAHASILTGRYPASHGVRHNGLYRLREEETTLAERLRDAGFDTAAFIGAFVLNRGFGVEQGFDTYDDLPGSRIESGHDQIFEAERTADQVNAAVFEWIEKRQDDRKVFLWVHYYDPHDPYEPPETPGRSLQGTGYDREISYIDACIGDLVERLDKAGLLDASVLIVAADHGESLGEHHESKHGVFLYEAAVRVPMLLRAPGILPANTRVKGQAELVDIAPTILDLLGLEPMEAAEGNSLLLRIRGENGAGPTRAFAETLMPRIEYGWAELRMIRDGRFKYIEAPTPELYDLQADPGESVNLASRDPERSAGMATMLSEWRQATSGGSGSGEARRTLSAEEEERLRSLGYLEGDAFRTDDEGDRERPDPKEQIVKRERLYAAERRLKAGDAAGALAGIDAILEENPGNHSARDLRVSALIALERWTEAEEEALAFVAAAEADPEVAVVHLEKARGLLASVYRLQGRAREAEEQYRLIIELNPVAEIAWADLARILVETGRREEAHRLLDEALAQNPRNNLALAERFLLEEEENDAEAASRSAAALADARAGDADVLRKAGDRLLEAGDPKRAAACFERALEKTGPDLTLLGKLGTAQIRAGDLEMARETFLKASRLRPEDARPHYFLGKIALGMGDENEGRARLERAAQLDDGFAPPLVTLGRWLALQGRREEALEKIEEALRRDPTNAQAREAFEKLTGD
jgi:arylsulfatase A-like enzyme/Flp pilus assembly protein TadD